ncbi:MAG: UPF0280 family protein [Bacteroidales bacterium]|nr:UPF0280 family protein [Bacteroidales bacterium]
MRKYYQFEYKAAKYRIHCNPSSPIINEIRKQRNLIEEYIRIYPEFQHALTPIPFQNSAPEIVKDMVYAAEQTGVGPMAAVAGAIAEYGAKAGMMTEAKKKEVIVENGGDIFCSSSAPVIVGLFLGSTNKLGKHIALKISPERTPLALCSSSSTMGHSLSFGNCDCATIAAKTGAIADAAATAACNKVKTINDVQPVLEWVSSIPGVTGALIIIQNTIGIVGDFPELIPHVDASYKLKITRDSSWDSFIATVI